MKNFKLLSIILCTAILFSQKGLAQNISTYAGCGLGNDSMATKAEICYVYGIATDNAGNTYIADYDNRMIRKVNASGIISTIAGTGIAGYTGNGGPATNADLDDIYGVAVDRTGNIYMTDVAHMVVRKINTSGIISRYAGVDDSAGYNGDNITALTAHLNDPAGITTDTAGNVYIADINNSRVRKVSASGIITTVVGTGTLGFSGMGGPATAAQIGNPYHVKFDKWGNLFVTDEGTSRIYKVDTAGIITNYAGTGFAGYSGDGGPATDAKMSAPSGLAIDTSDNVYFSDLTNSRVRMINATTGIITTVCGSGTAGFGGDGGPAANAEFSYPRELAFDNSGDLLIADQYNNRVRIVDPAGIITTFAGQNLLFGEGYPATNAQLEFVEDINTDASGNLYIVDEQNQRIRKVDAATGAITTVAGAGISGALDAYRGDGGAATAAYLSYPAAVAFDTEGNMYICDQENNRVREVNTSGIITTIAGNGTAGYLGNGGAATDAELNKPRGIVLDNAGNIYIADEYNFCIRKISASGIITTVAGNNTGGYSGNGGPATDAQLSYPTDVGFDGAGNLYIADASNEVIRMVDTAGNISTIAGAGGTYGFGGDGGPAVNALLDYPYRIKVDNNADILIADEDNSRVRLINSGGIISTVAGNGAPGFSGDGGPATNAKLLYPSGMAYDNSGNLFIADGGNQRVRVTGLTLEVPQVNAATQNIYAYPNPTVGLVYIANATNGSYTVTDICGKQIMSGSITGNKQTIDISSFASGVYLLEVTAANGVGKTQKIVKD